MKKNDVPDVSLKSTKDQILAAYNDILAKLNNREVENPQELKKKQEEKIVVERAASQSPDVILSDLSAIKLRSIKQLDKLSEEMMGEFQKLSDIRAAINFEQKHLEELYQIKETAHTLAALLQTHDDQKEHMKRERESQRQLSDESIAAELARQKQENDRFEREFKERQEKREKERKREEEDYTYTLDLKRRKEMDIYNEKKSDLEKELRQMKEDLEKREFSITEREKTLLDLQRQVDQFPSQLKEAVMEAEGRVRDHILQQHAFESQIKEKEHEGLIKLNAQRVMSLESKIKEQDALLKELNQKTDQATHQVQLIACRALEVSGGRFVSMASADDKNIGSTQKKE